MCDLGLVTFMIMVTMIINVTRPKSLTLDLFKAYITLVNVYVDLVVITRIAGTLKTGSGIYWP